MVAQVWLHAKQSTPRQVEAHLTASVGDADTLESAQAVESVIRSPAARRNLFEKYAPMYAHRPFFFTRVVNTFRLRMRDAAPMAYVEFVDRCVLKDTKTNCQRTHAVYLNAYFDICA